MKYIIATDIHGSAFWANKVVQKFGEHNADMLVLLGDVYNHGPRNPFPQEYAPIKVAEIFGALGNKVFSVQGNCDSQVDQMISNFPFVGDNVLVVGGRRLYLTHGHVFNKDNLPQLSKGDLLVYGHFHVSQIACVDGVTCVNVGSPSLPKDGKSAYCLVTPTELSVLDFDDNVICKVQL